MTKIEHQDFEDIAFEKQCEIVRTSPFPEKGELILQSQYPEELIETISPESFYLISKSMDEEMVPQLLEFADADQLLFFADFECFEQDRVNEKHFVRWITQLMEASEDKFLEWLTETDFDLVVTAYKKLVRIVKSTPEEVMDEVLQDEDYFSIDFLYYICIRKSNDFQNIKKSIELIYEHQRSLYVNLMECVLSEILAETEEEAFHNRQERLSVMGFPDKEEAIIIYRPMSESEWNGLEKKKEKAREMAKDNPLLKDTGYVAPIIHSSSRLFIDDVFAYVSETNPGLAEDLTAELLAVSNKILSLSLDRSYTLNEEIMKKALIEVKGVLNIALITHCRANLKRSADLLSEHWLEHVFRLGFTELAVFKKRAGILLKKYSFSDIEAFFQFFSGEYGSALRGFLRLSPRFYDPSVIDNIHCLREFLTPEDIAKTKERLETIENALELFGSLEDFGRLFDDTLEMNLSREELSSQNVLFTAFANFTVDGKMSARPVDRKKAAAFLKEAFTSPRKGKRALKSALVKSFFSRLEEALPGKSEKLRPFIEEGLRAAEEELEKVDIAAPSFDPRFIRCLLLRDR